MNANTSNSNRKKRKQTPPKRREQSKEEEIDQKEEDQKPKAAGDIDPESSLEGGEGDEASGSSPDSLSRHSLTPYEVQRKPRLLEESPNTRIIPADEAAGQITPTRRNRHSQRLSASPGSAANENEDKFRITCEYETLLNELRCVICFSTLSRAMIVRECLHRFCNTCVQTCLRRFRKNACPVCRSEIPTRRNLTVDAVYNTVIDSLRLNSKEKGDRQATAQQQRDEAAAIAKSLRSDQSPAKLQVAIARKQELRLQKLREATDGEHEKEQQKKIVPSKAVQLVTLHLKPNLHEELVLRPLDYPYLRISGDATISVLESFLKQKMRLQLPNPDGSIYFSTTSWRAAIPRKVKLSNLLNKRNNSINRDDDNAIDAGGKPTPTTIVLVYRQTKQMIPK